MDASPSGSSRRDSTLGRQFARRVQFEPFDGIAGVPKCFGHLRARSANSSNDGSLKPIVKVLSCPPAEDCAAAASTALELMPPLRKNPSGTSDDQPPAHRFEQMAAQFLDQFAFRPLAASAASGSRLNCQ